MNIPKSDKGIRAQGCLLGQAIGDALGTTYEFQSGIDTKKNINDNLIQGVFLPIRGGGPFGLNPGQITDDTELALALGRTLVKYGFNQEKVAGSYIRWIKSPPFDIGNTTRKALGNKAKNYDDMTKNALKFNGDSLSNGSLMRISPLAIWLTRENNKSKVKNCVASEVRITHCSPIAIDASQVFVLAIRDAIFGANKEVIYRNAINNATTVEIKNILKDAEKTYSPYVKNVKTGKLRVSNDGAFQGYLGVALQNAFYELLNGINFYHSLVQIVSRGGDTDTNAAIAGALLGAYYGINKIPESWIHTVLSPDNANGLRISQFPESNTQDLLDLSLRLLN